MKWRQGLNTNKSRAIIVGGWTKPKTPLGIELCQQVTILGVTFGPTMEETVRESWTKVTNAVGARQEQLTPATCGLPTGYNM